MMKFYSTKEKEERSEELKSEINLCKRFIELNFTPSKTYNKERTSYGLKHTVENQLKACANLGIDIKTYNPCYVSNEAFIIAMNELYYESKPDYRGSPNYYFKFKYIGPRIYEKYSRSYVMPHEKHEWEKVLDVVGKSENL